MTFRRWASCWPARARRTWWMVWWRSLRHGPRPPSLHLTRPVSRAYCTRSGSTCQSGPPDQRGTAKERPAHACAPSQVRDGGDYLGADDFQGGDLPDVGDRADGRLETHPGQVPQLVDHLGCLLALLPGVKDEVARLLDLVVVAALRVAVGAEHVELAGQVRAGEQVARLRVPGDEPQRLLLARAADHDRRMRL